MTHGSIPSSPVRRPEVFIRVFHTGSENAERAARRIMNTVGDMSHVNSHLTAADDAVTATLRAKTQSSADVWMALGATPLDDNATEVLLVPIASSRDDQPTWLAEFATQLKILNIPSADVGYRVLHNLGAPCILLHQIPWLVPDPASLSILAWGGGQSLGNSEAQARAAHATMTEYSELMQAVGSNDRDLPVGVRDGIHDHFRSRMARLWNCTDDVIPAAVNDLIKDELIRQFVRSAVKSEVVCKKVSLVNCWN